MRDASVTGGSEQTIGINKVLLRLAVHKVLIGSWGIVKRDHCAIEELGDLHTFGERGKAEMGQREEERKRGRERDEQQSGRHNITLQLSGRKLQKKIESKTNSLQ